jgi:hypothetical protein
MYWESVGPIKPGENVTVLVTQRFGYQRSYSRFTFCNDTTMIQRILCGEPGVVQCRNNCSWTLGSSEVNSVQYHRFIYLLCSRAVHTAVDLNIIRFQLTANEYGL